MLQPVQLAFMSEEHATGLLWAYDRLGVRDEGLSVGVHEALGAR